MKNLIVIVLVLIAALNTSVGQETQDTTSRHTKMFVVQKNDGAEYIGEIITQDEREILIETKKMGRIYIPKHEIKSIKEIELSKLTKDEQIIPEEIFSSRYFITTNGLPSKKGDSYIQWNLYGPDFQFGVADNLNLGIMTSWFGVPIIGSSRYSIALNDKLNLGVGALLGTGSWVQFDWGMLLPYSCITLGTKKNNLTFSGGYGLVFTNSQGNGRVLLAIAGITRIGEKFSLVFDSFIVPEKGGNNDGFALFIPGIRWQSDSKKAFQFGFAAIQANGTLAPFPFPMVQWYRKL